MDLMSRFILTPIFLLTFFCTMAQRHPAQPVIEAERSFAASSRETNTRNAFLKYFTDDGLMALNGKLVNAKTFWTNREVTNTLLNWWPTVAEISQDGQLGYTTGPYQFFGDRDVKNLAPLANGYYSTVWQKQTTGEWKILVDLGMQMPLENNLPTTVEPPILTASKAIKPVQSIDDVEKNYVHKLNLRGVSFELVFLAENFRLHRPGQRPLLNVADLKKLTNDKYQFQVVGTGMSISKDMAYAYGNVRRVKEGATEAVELNYLRIWVLIDSQWKIVHDVITGE
jgi:ketosteroid isomerase-like protein